MNKIEIKLVAILILLTASILIVGCHKRSKQEIETKNQVLRVNNQGDFSSLHPHTGIDLQCRILQKSLFESLTRIGIDGKPELAGAEKVHISDNHKTYTFSLRPMKWTNGKKVTAFDFESAWKKAVAPHSNCLRADLFYPIKNAEKVKKGEVPIEELKIFAKDEHTFIVELEHPTPYFLDLIANPLFSPLYDEDETPKVFNGPFTISNWNHDKHLILEKNEKYWDACSVKLNRIEISLVTDAHTALLMYEKKELDWIGHPFTNLPQDALPNLEKSSLEYHAMPIDGIYWISLNTHSFPLNSVNIRKALSISLNREAIAKHVLYGETPTRSIVPKTVSLLKDDELYPDGDIKLAKKYFEEGLKELNLSQHEFPKLKLSHSDVPGQKKLAEALQRSWNQTFGIEVELIGSEWNVFFSGLGQRQFQIGGCIWFCVFHDPIYTLEFFKFKEHRYNAAGWENVHFQKLLALADHEVDPIIRKMHLKQAELLLLDEMPIIPLFIFNSKYLKSPHLKNITVNELGHADFKWAYFE